MKKTLFAIATLMASSLAFAQEHAAAAAGSGIGDKGIFALGAAIAVGLAALGGTLSQGKIGGAAMDGIARNPQAGKDMFTPMIIALALVESLVILSWLMAFFLNGHIGG